MARVIVTTDGDRRRFFGGEVIEGHAFISFEAGRARPAKVTGVEVSLVRLGKVGHGEREDVVTMEWIPIETLAPAGEGDPVDVPFSLATRQDARGTFREGSASLTYVIRCAIHRPGARRKWKSADVEVEIVPTVDRDDPAFVHAVHNDIRKKVRRLTFFPRGTVGGTIDLPRTAFCAGDVVPTTLTVSNNSSTTVHSIVARIVQVVTHGRSRSERVLAESPELAPENGLSRGNVLALTTETLTLPADVSPTERGGLFAVSHGVRLDVLGSGTKVLLMLRSEFVVATTRGLPPGVRPRSVSVFTPRMAAAAPEPAPAPSAAAASSSAAAAATPDVSAQAHHRTHSSQLPSLCVVCQSARSTTAALNCGHRCLCDSCAVRFSGEGASCPICRQPMTGTCHIYDT